VGAVEGRVLGDVLRPAEQAEYARRAYSETTALPSVSASMPLTLIGTDSVCTSPLSVS